MVAPWFGLIGIMLAGRANLGTDYFAAASVQAAVVLHAPNYPGRQYHRISFGRYFPMSRCCCGLMVPVFFCFCCFLSMDCYYLYSIGYMRGLRSMFQPRFILALSLSQLWAWLFSQPADHLFFMNAIGSFPLVTICRIRARTVCTYLDICFSLPCLLLR